MSCRATFALGTAAGDQSDLRFLFADIVTRPLGASFADWAGVSHARGGLNVGAGLVALVLTMVIMVIMVIIALVSYLSATPRSTLAPDRIQH